MDIHLSGVFYRWLEQMSLKTIPTQSVTVKEFGFSDKCEEILESR